MEIPDALTGIYGETVKIKRFHDAYRSSIGQQDEAGFVNKKFADKMLFGLIVAEKQKRSSNRYEYGAGSRPCVQLQQIAYSHLQV